MDILKEISVEVARMEKLADTNSPQFFSTTPTYLTPDPRGKIPRIVDGRIVMHSLSHTPPEPPKPKREFFIGAAPEKPRWTPLKGDVAPRVHRAYTGWYGMLGAPQLQATLDAANDYAKERGSVVDKIMSSVSQLPQKTVASAGAAALSAAGAAAYPKAMEIVGKNMLPISGTVGAVSGTKKGIETGSVAQGVKTGITDAAMTYGIGKLYSMFPRTMLTFGSGVPFAMSAANYAMTPSMEDAEKYRHDAYTNMVSSVKSNPERVGSDTWKRLENMHADGMISENDFSAMKSARREYMARELSKLSPEQLNYLLSIYGAKTR